MSGTGGTHTLWHRTVRFVQAQANSNIASKLGLAILAEPISRLANSEQNGYLPTKDVLVLLSCADKHGLLRHPRSCCLRPYSAVTVDPRPCKATHSEEINPSTSACVESIDSQQPAIRTHSRAAPPALAPLSRSPNSPCTVARPRRPYSSEALLVVGSRDQPPLPGSLFAPPPPRPFIFPLPRCSLGLAGRRLRFGAAARRGRSLGARLRARR